MAGPKRPAETEDSATELAVLLGDSSHRALGEAPRHLIRLFPVWSPTEGGDGDQLFLVFESGGC